MKLINQTPRFSDSPDSLDSLNSLSSLTLEKLLKNFSWREIRNAVFGFIVVAGGLGLAGVTVWAKWASNPRLAGAAALASLGFVVLILLFVVPPLARSASREVSQIDLPLELTSGGLIFLGIVAIVSVAAWNTGNNLLFLVLSFLLATLVISFVLGSVNLKKLEAKVRFPEAIFAAAPIAFAIGLNNHKFLLPTFSVSLALRGSMTDDPFGGRKFSLVRPPTALARFLRAPWLRRAVGYFVYVPRQSATEQQTEQLFEKRGRFIIKDFELSTKFPFGFWQRRRRLQVRETEIFIFPQPADIRDILPVILQQAGRFDSLRRGAGQDLLGLREYQSSDDLRHVDWKATARTGNLFTRQYSAEDERRLTIIFDSALEHENPSAQITDRFERGVSLTAALVTQFVNENIAVRLITSGGNSDFSADKAHLYESLRRLATIEAQFEENESEYLETLLGYLQTDDLIVLLTSRPDIFSAANRDLQIIPF